MSVGAHLRTDPRISAVEHRWSTWVANSFSSVPVLVPVLASPVPSVVRESFVVNSVAGLRPKVNNLENLRQAAAAIILLGDRVVEVLLVARDGRVLRLFVPCHPATVWAYR